MLRGLSLIRAFGVSEVCFLAFPKSERAIGLSLKQRYRNVKSVLKQDLPLSFMQLSTVMDGLKYNLQAGEEDTEGTQSF